MFCFRFVSRSCSVSVLSAVVFCFSFCQRSCSVSRFVSGRVLFPFCQRSCSVLVLPALVDGGQSAATSDCSAADTSGRRGVPRRRRAESAPAEGHPHHHRLRKLFYALFYVLRTNYSATTVLREVQFIHVKDGHTLRETRIGVKSDRGAYYSTTTGSKVFLDDEALTMRSWMIFLVS